MIVYIDTSDLVKLYVDESGSDAIKEIVHKATVISTSKVAYAEARAAFARKQRDDGFSFKVLRKIVEDFNREWERGNYRFIVGMFGRAYAKPNNNYSGYNSGSTPGE